MITDEEVKRILKKETLETSDMLQVIQRYIHDKKGKEVYINPPDNVLRIQMMWNAYLECLGWYTLEKFNNNLD